MIRAIQSRRGGPSVHMTRRYEDDLKLFRTTGQKVGLGLAVALYVAFPLVFDSPFWTTVLVLGGIAAVGAIGLNLLTGFTGQVSLGHAFFLGVGAYVGSWMNRGISVPFIDGSWQAPMPVWLLGAAVIGGLIGGVVGPFALRLRGNYLVIVTLGLVFLGEHLYNNWDSLTGGSFGTRTFARGGGSVTPDVAVGPLDFADLSIAGQELSRDQGLFWLVWLVVAVVALLAKNVVRTRPGRALQAVRDRDVAAEIIGVSLARYKVGAFVLSSAIAGVAGALLGAQLRQVTPIDFTIFLSIQYVAMIIVGGLGTIFGSVLGAIFLVAIPEAVKQYSDTLTDLTTVPGTDYVLIGQAADDPLITIFAFNRLLFGLLIIAFLVFEPRGLAAIWLRLKAYVRTWPFSY